MQVAQQIACVIEMRVFIGDYVREGGPLFFIRGPWDGEQRDAITSAVNFASERTMDQDAGFGIRQLVDIGERALSPGINDPTTAVQAIDLIHGLLGKLVEREIPSPFRDVDGTLALIFPRPDWGDYVALACDELRRAGGEQMQIQRRLRAMILDLSEAAPPERRPALVEQLQLLDQHLTEGFFGAERARAQTPSAKGQGPA
jgi:uncharacterized membrane protein